MLQVDLFTNKLNLLDVLAVQYHALKPEERTTNQKERFVVNTETGDITLYVYNDKFTFTSDEAMLLLTLGIAEATSKPEIAQKLYRKFFESKKENDKNAQS